MRTAIICLLALAAFASDLNRWEAFKERYASRSHRAMVGEGEDRYAIFLANMRRAEQLNTEAGAVFGVTKFADLTPDEFQKYYLSKQRISNEHLPLHVPTKQANAIDWRGRAVTSVKDQGSCGSCWAFSSVAAVEACIMLGNGGKAVDVSPQLVLDCCRTAGSGCNGGTTADAVVWASENPMASWDSYPYKAAQQKCKSDDPSTVIVTTADQCQATRLELNEDVLQQSLQEGPISISIAGNALQLYVNGIINGTKCKNTQINHAVLLAGLTDDPAWVVKNSWGPDWGEEGYYRAEVGVNCLGIITRQNTLVLPKH